MDGKEKTYLSQCKLEIEKKLNWQESETWNLRDYEYLSDRIFEDTGVLLSVSTLRRIWKKDYSSKPHPGTLDALANFLGCNNWNDFKSNRQNDFPPIEKSDEDKIFTDPQNTSRKKFQNRRFVTAFVITIVVTVSVYFFSSHKSIPNSIVFDTEVIQAEGFPKSLIYNYNISEFGVDSAYIVESWQPNKRIPIASDKKKLIDVYHFPGFVSAELIINEETIKEHYFHLKTDGWIALARENWSSPIPIHINKGVLKREGNLYIDPPTLELNKVKTDEGFYISFYNVKDFGADGDNFLLHTKIKNSLDEGANFGQYFYIIIMGENGRTYLPFSDIRYVANINAIFNDAQINGMEEDLSAFGCDMSEWIDIKYKVENREVSFFRDGEKTYAYSQESTFGKIMGLHFIFYGSGKIDFVTLSDLDGKTLYEDNFD